MEEEISPMFWHVFWSFFLKKSNFSHNQPQTHGTQDLDVPYHYLTPRAPYLFSIILHRFKSINLLLHILLLHIRTDFFKQSSKTRRHLIEIISLQTDDAVIFLTRYRYLWGVMFIPVLRTRIRTYVFWPSGPESVSQEVRIRILLSSRKYLRKNLMPTVLWLLYDFLFLKNDVNKCTFKK